MQAQNPISEQINQQSLEFSFLREAGMERIRALAGKSWTDHNLHDPGITILEHLCFALQDLNYRTSFPIADLLASQSGQNEFFGLEDLLPTSPVTMEDFRKVLIDMDGIRNAIILPIERPEPHIYVDKTKGELSSVAPDDGVEITDILSVKGMSRVLLELEYEEELGDLNDNKIIEISHLPDGISELIVEFPRWDEINVDWSDDSGIIQNTKSIVYRENGQINRWVDQWDDLPEEIKTVLYGPGTNQIVPLIEQYRRRVARAHEIRESARKKLNGMRNVCEDFLVYESVKIEEIAINADIEIDPEADIQEVLAEIFYQTNKFLSPTLEFRQPTDPGFSNQPVEDIFDGPLLDHGIIQSSDLPERKILLQVSDLINIIMDIQGIKSVKSFSADSLPEGILLRGGNQWCIKLNPEANYTPRLTAHRSVVMFYRDDFPITASLAPVIDLYNAKRSTDKKWDEGQELVVSMQSPLGKKRELGKYYSIQNDFTSNYGIGHEGLPPRSDEHRQIQAKQLKGYLIFYEQILANCQAQLANFSKLFSVHSDVVETYFSQLLQDVPDIDDLYSKELVTPILKEGNQIFLDRRNRFLNHLIARLGMKISDYAMLTSDHQGDKPAAEKIAAKIDLLRSYPEISSSRFRSFDHQLSEDLWNTTNVSGLKKRICLLMGIKDPSRRNLAGLDAQPNNEGFHLVEHAMLRPRMGNDRSGNPLHRKYLKIFSKPRCQDGLWREDPYSYLISFILPNWIGRFSDLQFRHYFERTAYLESPSHIGIQFFWLGPEKLEAFEMHYRSWLDLNAQSQPEPLDLSNALNHVIDQLNSFQLKEDFDEPEAELPVRPQPLSQDWKTHDFGDGSSQWVYGEGNTLRQLNYHGSCRRMNSGEGTVALFKGDNIESDTPGENTNQHLEAIDLKLTMDHHEFSEAGLVFMWQNPDNYWLFHYRVMVRKVLISQVKDGVMHKILENSVVDLRGKSIHFNIERHKGNLKCRQKSPNTIGTEFLLNLTADFGGTWYGLYTRYSRSTEFNQLKVLDPDLLDQEMIPSVGIGYWTIGEDFEIK